MKVQAGEHEGDGGLPFEQIAKHVDIHMAADATAPQIMDVLDEYDDEIQDGDVYHVNLTLRGRKRATLGLGEGIQATESMVQDLVKVQADVRVTEYVREAFPVLPSVHLTVTPMEFDELVAIVDRYSELDDIEDVGVRSGGYILSRDVVNESPRLYEFRERFVSQLNTRFQLTGALVSGGGPLRLAAKPEQLAAIRGYIDQHPAAGSLGEVVVDTKVRIPT